jgi:hypothetical protein
LHSGGKGFEPPQLHQGYQSVEPGFLLGVLIIEKGNYPLVVGKAELDQLTHSSLDLYTTGCEKRLSMRGNPYWVWRREMPRVEDALLDCIIYLYPTKKDACDGEHVGGTGFLVGIQSQVFPEAYYGYAVTNSHVIKEARAPVVRLNTRDGQTDVVNLKPENWFHHPNGDDVAVCPMGLPGDRFKFMFLGEEVFLTEKEMQDLEIGIGDEIFMVGRFVSHEGKQRNMPSVRFGNISMMPSEPIRHPTRGIMVDAYLVEARSIAGYSGSPVFVHILPMTMRPKNNKLDTTYKVRLLGIDFGHMRNVEKVRQKGSSEPVPEGWWVAYNSGMMMVSPVSKLSELLNIDVLIEQRRLQDEAFAKEKHENGIQLDAQPYSQADFMNALGKVSQIKQPESDSGQTGT